MNESRYQELAKKWGERGLSGPQSRHWKRVARALGCSLEEAKEFGQRLLQTRGTEPPKAPFPKPLTNETATVPTKVESEEDKYTHANTYWHDPERDIYVVWLPHLPKPMALPAHMWAGIKAAYSQWHGSPASVEEIARKFSLTRRTVTALLRVMSHTHTGSPWTREHVASVDDQSLVEDLILAREERVLRQAETQRWNRVKAKAESWEKLQLGCLDALNEWLTSPPKPRGSSPPVEVKIASAPYIAVLGLTDLHYGSLDHDAEEALNQALEGAVRRLAVRGTPEKIVLPIGSDGMHFDTAGYTTTSGTRMEVSGPAREVVVGYMELMARVVEDLSHIAPVHCIPLAGNHDRMMSFATFAAMRLAFRGNDRVSFSTSLSDIQVVTHGKTLVALHHGDRHKPDALMGIIPRDFSPEWGQTQYRYCLLGHFHTPGTFSSKSGLECVYMPSLAPSDEWTEGQGFRSQPAMSIYIFDATEGLVAVDTVRGR